MAAVQSESRPRQKVRLDYALIESMVPEGSRVLDLGCGDGELLQQLCLRKHCSGYGIEINDHFVTACLRRGVAVYHGDMLEGIEHLADHSFDVVVLSQTLQQSADPLRVVREMLRVGSSAIISFPNFGYWKTRLQLLVRGRMPRHDLLPYTWYNTPNVHLCTVADFRDLCEDEGLLRVQEIFLVGPHRRIGRFLANWRAAMVIFQLRGA